MNPIISVHLERGGPQGTSNLIQFNFVGKRSSFAPHILAHRFVNSALIFLDFKFKNNSKKFSNSEKFSAMF